MNHSFGSDNANAAAGAERAKVFKKVAFDSITDIMKTQPVLDVVQLLALHLSTDCKLQQQIACHWAAPFCLGSNASLQTELSTRFMSLLTEPIRLEVRTKTENRVHGFVHLFGPELAIFSIPFDLLGVNYVAYTCMLRLMTQGHRTLGRRAFSRLECSANNCEVTYSEFGLNNTLQSLLARGPFLTSIVSYLAATAHRANMIPVAVGAPRRNYNRAMRVLLLGALSDTLSQISGGTTVAAVQGREISVVRTRCTWLDDKTMEELYRIRSHCKTDAMFNVKAFLSLLIHQYERIVTESSKIK